MPDKIYRIGTSLFLGPLAFITDVGKPHTLFHRYSHIRHKHGYNRIFLRYERLGGTHVKSIGLATVHVTEFKFIERRQPAAGSLQWYCNRKTGKSREFAQIIIQHLRQYAAQLLFTASLVRQGREQSTAHHLQTVQTRRIQLFVSAPAAVEYKYKHHHHKKKDCSHSKQYIKFRGTLFGNGDTTLEVLVQACRCQQLQIGIAVDVRCLNLTNTGKGTACLTAHTQHTLRDIIYTVYRDIINISSLAVSIKSIIAKLFP